MKILKIFSGLLIIIFINCAKPVDKCNELVKDICESKTPYNECLKEVEEYLTLSCN